MDPWSFDPVGRFEQLEIQSEALKGNPLGDPYVRPLVVYVPPGYDGEPKRRYASVYVIQGMTGFVTTWFNRTPFRKNFPQLLDEQFARGECEPCVVVFVDAWTALGGSQFLDSAGTGAYHTFLCDEVVPFVDGRYRTVAAAAQRGIAGKSSGGYGAMVTPMLRPDLFGGLATHAGDALFELCYAPDFRRDVRALRDLYGGSFDRFWEDFRAGAGFGRETDYHLVNDYTMAACYSANADGTVELPYDLETGQLRPDVWERWLAWDPVRMVPRYADALRGMKAIYIDAGTGDEYFLDLGAEAFRRALLEIGVSDVSFELFPGKHGGIEHRYPIALRYLAERLAP